MPTMRGGGVAAVIDGRIDVAGGRPPRGHDFAVYDPKADKWTALPNLPTQRNHLAAGAHEAKFMSWAGVSRAVFAVRPLMRKRFSILRRIHGRRKSRCSGRVAASMASRQWLLSSIWWRRQSEYPYGVFPDHDYYNPVTDNWHALEPLPIAVHGVTGLAFIDGNIHLPGGGTAKGGSSGSTIHQVYRPSMSCR